MSEQIVEQTVDHVPFTEAQIYQPPVETRNLEQTRFLFFAGTVVLPEAARQRPWLKAGGVEIYNPCLRYLKNFLRRGRITPLLLDSHNPVPRELVDQEGDISVYYAMPQAEGATGLSPLVTRRAYPGHQINLILQSEATSRGMPRGVVELRSLAGHNYRPEDLGNGLFLDPQIWKIQRAIFPDYPSLPLLISDMKTLIAKGRKAEPEIADDAMISVEQFEQFARVTVETAHMAMKQTAATANGYVPDYSPVVLVLMEQLGQTPQYDELKRLAQSHTGESTEMLKLMISERAEERAAYLTALERIAGKEPAQEPAPVNSTTMMAPVPELLEKPEYEFQHAQSATGAQVFQEPPSDKKMHWKTKEKLERDAQING